MSRGDARARIRLLFLFVGASALAACAAGPGRHLWGGNIPAAAGVTGDGIAKIRYSADKRYETEKGVPLSGDALVCTRGTVGRVQGDDPSARVIGVRAGEEIAVTSVITWVNTGWEKRCGPFVRFVPEAGSSYVVVNERIGGKGAAMLWTGAGLQTCEVSVYRELPSGFSRVVTKPVEPGTCRVPDA